MTRKQKIFLIIIVILALVVMDYSIKVNKNNNLESQKDIITAKDIKEMSDDDFMLLKPDQMAKMTKGAEKAFEERRAKETEEFEKSGDKLKYDDEIERFEERENNNELNKSVKNYISRSMHLLNVHSDGDVKRYSISSEVDSRGIEKPNVNIDVYLNGEFKSAAEFSDEQDIIQNYEEYVSSSFINDRGSYGRQFNNIKIEFYYEDLPYAYTEINVNEKYEKGTLLEKNRIRFY
ncbi:hypothetical protein [Staphylococcus chromogenes]|uniref:hypothetical protein n=1 Tax=Staphylococcus chromogenes TaxID=46126 RepID=UPI0028889505|nr:hypothetical protein [Staphylococcus chromogenes]MDT0698525.1 hypothetical protein [Staphylococcus chromogenes]